MTITKKRQGILLIILILVLTACDQTQLSGTLQFVPIEDESDGIYMVLDVPNALDEIYRVHFEAVDLVSGESMSLVYGDALSSESKSLLNTTIYATAYLEKGRAAVFYPPDKGFYRIEVSGFYKQTNPQPITTMQVVIQ